MLRIICKYYLKAYKSPQTRVGFNMIGHSSTSCVVVLRQCVNTRGQNATASPFYFCCYGVWYGKCEWGDNLPTQGYCSKCNHVNYIIKKYCKHGTP